MEPAALATMFGSYGDAGGHWTGGDGTASVPLPDGRVVWLFADTYLGSVNADGSRPASAPMVNNTIVVQDGTTLTTTLHGGTATTPEALVKPAAKDEYFWAADGTVEAGSLKVLYNRYRRTGSGMWDFSLVGTALASFGLPSLTLSSVVDLPLNSTIAWGSAVLEGTSHTYIFGSSSDSSGMKFGHVARVPSGGLGGTWEFWNGNSWSATEATTARLLSGVGTSYAVQQVGDHYVLTTQENNVSFNPQFVAYTAPSPTGPFSGPIDLFTAPEQGPGTSAFVYTARLHPELARSGKLLMSYDVNSFKAEDNLADARLYRPRFVELDWPRPQPDPTKLPAAPTGVTVTADSVGGADLQWSAPAGSGLTYRVYQRDVTAGQTHFVRVAQPTETAAKVGFLRTGRTYEFRVTALNNAGEGPPTAIVSTQITIAPPSAPTGVAATPNNAGGITVSWTAVPNAWRYDVYRRDVTAGEPELAIVGTAQSGQTILAMPGLEHQHEYEFAVEATHGGGTSPPSPPVRATASYAPPGAPTALTATAQTDGSIRLTWTAPTENLWFHVYQRDVTAGEADFTKLEYPVTECCTMTAGLLTHGHEYEYKITALNAGGEGTASTTARATSMLAPPGAPTALTATAQTDGSIRLTWTAPTENLWFHVYQRDVTAGEADFTKLEYPVTECCTMTAGLLTHGHEYEYKITALNAGGEGTASTTARATAEAPSPVAPTNLHATAGSAQITLTWDSSDPSAWYWVYLRDVTTGEDFHKLEYPVITCCTMTAGELTNGHIYEFKVTTIGTAGGRESEPSNVVVVQPVGLAPGTPSDLTALAGNGQVTLNWTASSTPDSWYWVYMRDVTAGGEFRKLEYPVTTCCTMTAGQLTNGHTYEFKVTTIGTGGPDSSPSNTVSAQPVAPAPGAPGNLTATASNGQVTLNWTASSTPNSWYWVYMRDVTAGDEFRKLEYPVTTCCTMTAGQLTNGHTYQFKVTAVGTDGAESEPSNTVSARPVAPAPGAPGNLTATASNGQVTLNWTASSTPNSWYWVYVRDVTNGESFRKLEYPVTTCCTMTAGQLTNGHTYQFKVTTVGTGGPDSSPSNTVSARPVAPVPGAPSGLYAIPGDGKVTLVWTASSTPNSWYRVYLRNATTGQSWQQVPVPINTCCTFTAGYLVNGHIYEFKVATIGTGGAADSPTTNAVSAQPMQPVATPPSNLTATAGDGKAVLRWTASATPHVMYWIYLRNVSTGGGWQRLPLPISTCCTFTGSYLTNGQTYEFAVSAFNGRNESATSNVVRVYPAPPAPNAPGRPVATTWLSADKLSAITSLTWGASTNTQSVFYRLDYRNSTRQSNWNKIEVGPNRYYSTPYFIGGDTYEVRILAWNMSGSTFSSSTFMEPKRSKPALYNYFTYPSATSQSAWQNAKNNSGRYSEYGFNWSDNGCSNPADTKFTYEYGNDFFRVPCQRHDFGYRNHGSTWGYKNVIDNTMLYDMNQLCAHELWGGRQRCESSASNYYWGVWLFGGIFW
ncbi:phospholipase A2 [Micromonospora sonneratiae]|uniref:Phospholipase A2 n=2 Tax=Micromonospora sonneratiae TaxID=1184706 RepID=A0ABW3YDP8_9ACTN